MVPSSIQLSLRPPTFVSPSDPSTDHQRDRRPSVDLGSSNLRETGNLPSIFALQDELDMLQEENESIIEKLQLAEERCVEAEARARQFEEQVASVGEGLSFEARLLSRREAYLLQREGALKDAEQTHDVKNVQVSTLRLEAETAKDEAESSLEQLHEAEYEIKSLQTLTQRLILSQEEMEEVVLKRCWLSRHWNLCFQYGIHAEIASEKYEFWSSLAPLPLEVVLSAGQKAKEESSVEKNDVEERDKDPRDLNELSGEGNIESMLLVEKGMRELASLKVEDAVMLAMAQHRLPHLLKYDQRVSGADDLKLTVDNQLLLEACELSEEESQDVAFKQAWLIYFWRRAKNHGLEQDITDERLQFWIINSTRSPTPYDVVDVERGLMELRKLGIETRLWEESRRVIDPGFSHSKISFDSYL
ncbi:coiled-coil domain-containing protein SCD2-like isoform X4 [Macadamia integrifolia]|nr:coiled-coil domain-containing protein SCD2-like isoform X4 [Macadamia integrifolia]